MDRSRKDNSGDQNKGRDAMIEDVLNYLKIDDHMATGGQPNAEQFADIANAGYSAVINLALPTSDNAIANEGAIVSSLAMSYAHLPVDFAAPTIRDYKTFRALMNTFRTQKVFVHCAMNMRVSAFMYLYRVTELGIDRNTAQEDLRRIWEPNETWQGLIEVVLSGSR